MKNVLLLFLGFVLPAFIACEKTAADLVPPTVTLTSPTDGQVFLKGETITISGTVADERGLHEGSLKVSDKTTGATLLHEHPEVHDATTYPFSYTYTVPAALTEQHEYQVSAVFYDHDDNVTTKTVSVVVKPN